MTKIILLAVVLAVVFVFSLALGLWLLLGRGPRRHRAFRQAQRLLERGNWKETLGNLATLSEEGRLSPVWQERPALSSANAISSPPNSCSKRNSSRKR